MNLCFGTYYPDLSRDSDGIVLVPSYLLWLSLRRKIRAVADGDAATWPGYAHVALPIARRIPFAPRFRLVVVAAGGDEPSTCLVLLTGTALCCIFQAQWARYIIYLHDFPGDHLNQSPFQDPKLEVPTIYKAYIRPM